MRRHISYSHKDRIPALITLARDAAYREGLSTREAKQVAMYSLILYGEGRSAGWAISQATRYARVLSGKSTWAGMEA